MASSSKPAMFVTVVVVTMILQSTFLAATSTGLCPYYYEETCPNLLEVVKAEMEKAIAKEPRIGASIIRLFFHDCFVNGCDGSLLLDDTPTFVGEKTSPPNINSVRGFEVIDDIKEAVEKACPGVVSCADILAIASRDSVALLGGPAWEVLLGRKDARLVSGDDFFTLALIRTPPPNFNLTNLVESFRNVTLSAKDVVVLSGTHTIGLARCITFRDHIYNNDTVIDSSFRALRQKNCPARNGTGDDNLAPLDIQTPRLFNNDYYKNLVQRKGLLNSDQELFNGSFTDCLVLKYSKDEKAFFRDFVKSMIRMGNIMPSEGTHLEVRRNCRRVN